MTPLQELVIAVFDGELSEPLPRAGALLREALAQGYVEQCETLRPLRVTAAGIAWLRQAGLVRANDTAVR